MYGNLLEELEEYIKSYNTKMYEIEFRKKEVSELDGIIYDISDFCHKLTLQKKDYCENIDELCGYMNERLFFINSLVNFSNITCPFCDYSYAENECHECNEFLEDQILLEIDYKEGNNKIEHCSDCKIYHVNTYMHNCEIRKSKHAEYKLYLREMYKDIIILLLKMRFVICQIKKILN